MSSPNLPTSITPGATNHISHTNTVHGIVNKFDAALGSASSGQVLEWNGTVYAPASTKIDKTSAPILATDTAYGLSGNVDNTAAMQAALDAAAAAGKNIHFPQRSAGVPYMIGGSGLILKVAPGVKITADPGVVFKVKNSNGDYKSMLGGTIAGSDLSNLVVDGVTFDQNTTNNTVSDVAKFYVDGTQRFCILAGVGTNINIRRCRFTNIDGLNVVYLGGSAMKDVRVQDCEFDLVGTSPARHDHSTIYTSCDGSTITGNKFRGVLSSLGATTAIETHGSSQVVIGNRIDGFRLGMNITGITPIGNDGIVVQGNTIDNVLIGIQLWSWDNGNGGLKNCHIDNNTIRIDRDAWWYSPSSAYSHGICVSQDADDITHIEQLRITRNTITHKAVTNSLANDYQNSAGIEVVTTDAALEARVLEVSDNVVIGALGPGLRLSMVTKVGKIANNTWIDCSATAEGGVPTFWRSGMCLLNSHYDLQMYGNRTFDRRGTHVLVQGYATSFAGSVARIEQWDNTITCSDGVVLPGGVETSGKWFTPRPFTSQRFASGLYYGPKGGRSTITVADGQMHAAPFTVECATTFVRIGCEVTTLAASTNVRLGIYLDNGAGAPGALVLDAGTVDASTTGAKEITISQALPPGVYWLVAVAQGGGPILRSVSTAEIGSAGNSTLADATSSTIRNGFYASGVSGALPASFTWAGQTTPALVVLKAA